MSQPNIYDRWNDAQPFDRLLFRSDRILQSAEMNEVQSSLRARVRDVADVLMADGDVVRAADIVVDADTGVTVCEAGAIYAGGAVRGVPPATITIPVAGAVQVGVFLRSQTITELEDPSLLNPAAGTRGYMQPGAAREVVQVHWGHAGDGQAGTFYAIWLVEDGIVRPKDPPPTLSAVTQALARYDRDSAGGTYIVRGLGTTMLPDADGKQVYTLAEGAARVGGRGIELPVARRVVYDAQPALLWIDSEPQQSAGTAPQRVNFDFWPMVGVPQVRITSRKTVTLNHGGFAGAADALPDSSVLTIETVTQGGTAFTAATDYLLTAGQVDWSPAGAEPAPGSSYDVTYTYLHQAEPTDVDATGFTVAGALEGSLILTSYNHALRRIDRMCLTIEGAIEWVRGVPAKWEPVAPPVPANMLPLASVHQFWDARRRLVPDGVRVVPMDELNGYRSRIDSVFTDLAELRLAVDVSGRYSGIKKGLFADPFIDDGMRDAGTPQTAAISGGALQLPMAIAVAQLGTDITERATAAHNHAAVLSQTARTGSMLVNPYQAFEPMPSPAVIKPAVDRWTTTETVLGEARTMVGDHFFMHWQQVGFNWQRTETAEVGSSTAEAEFLREIDIEFDLSFAAGESLASLTFDGIAIAAQPLPGGTLATDAQGHLRGKFTVPPDVPAGTKLVRFVGTLGSRSDASFTGQGTVIRREVAQITYLSETARGPSSVVFMDGVDPLAQTFTLPAASQCSGVDLTFTAKGPNRVLVQLRNAEQGFPTREVLAQASLTAGQIAVDGTTTRAAWTPVLLESGREYALVVLTDDATTALAVATLGAWDAAADRWVTSQPYQVGVLLSSSNASTWTAHQDRDMAFTLLAPAYTEAERVIDLGTTNVTDATDLMLRAFVHQPSAAAGAEFELQLDGGQLHRVAPGQVVRLPARYSGPVQARARLRSAGGVAAVLEPGVQLVAGSLQTSATYISPMLKAGGNVDVRVLFEAALPAGTSLQVHAQTDADGAPWVLVPYASASPATAGVLELTHQLDDFAADRLRLRITLTGTHQARPMLRNLRAVIL